MKFLRIDADLTDSFKDESKKENEAERKKAAESLKEVFRKALDNDKLEVKAEYLKNEGVASMITTSEESRRMQDMMKMYGMAGMDFGAPGETLVLNLNHPLVTYVMEHKDEEDVSMFCEQLYDLALLAHGSLTPERMSKFITRSNEVMMKLTK